MLGKIINISTNPDLRQPRKSHGFGKFFAGGYSHSTDVHDSVTLSPALLYLNEIKWQLKVINHSSNEKLMVVFIAAGLEFSTTIDMLDISYIDRLNYDVLKEREHNGEKTKALAHFSAKVNYHGFDEFENVIEFKGFKIFFDRLFLLDMDCELNASESKAIDNLLDGINDRICDEFDYINSGILTFIEKLKGIKLPRLAFVTEQGNLVTLLKIKTSNAEILKPERTVTQRIL